MQFFAFISVIDDVMVQCVGQSQARIILNTVKLGQLREGGPNPGERLDVEWYYNGGLIPEFNNLFSVQVNTDLFVGSWTVQVHYVTPLVRHDPQQLLYFFQEFQVVGCAF